MNSLSSGATRSGEAIIAAKVKGEPRGHSRGFFAFKEKILGHSWSRSFVFPTSGNRARSSSKTSSDRSVSSAPRSRMFLNVKYLCNRKTAGRRGVEGRTSCLRKTDRKKGVGDGFEKERVSYSQGMGKEHELRL